MIDSKRTSVRFFFWWLYRIWCACCDGQGEGRAQSVAVAQVCRLSRAHRFLAE